MQYSQEIDMILRMVDDFGEKELMSAYRELEPEGKFPAELVKTISSMGLMGISFPEEYGGMGMNTVATSVVGERLAFYWPSLQLIWSANVSLAGFPIMTFGSEEQKRRLLPRLATGEILGCYALTEPDAGSDAASIQTKAEYNKKRKVWIINGVKLYITNAEVASVGVVFAKRAYGGKNYEKISAFILESEEPGLKIPGVTIRDIPKWGLRCSHFAEIRLDNAEVPEGMMLGARKDGWRIAMQTLNNGRINIAAQAVGIARRALREMKEYAKTRKAFGKRLMDIEEKAKRIAWLETQTEAAWLMVLRASEAKDSGRDYRVEASEAKLFASRVAKEVTVFFSEFAAAIGYTLAYIAEYLYQDARATVIYEGTSDIQELVIAKSFQN